MLVVTRVPEIAHSLIDILTAWTPVPVYLRSLYAGQGTGNALSSIPHMCVDC